MLYLSGNGIEHQGAQELAKPLKSFNLGVNRMTDIDAQRYHHTLLINKFIINFDLDISYNRITDNGVKDLADALKMNREKKIIETGVGYLAVLLSGHATCVTIHLQLSSFGEEKQNELTMNDSD
ncbi:unnamed protein product [Adineta ricciae]|uniref:Uncharacterized protein n=1 Tax=Adineta ricciae TaxID=249248 RepID=A0A815E5T7_ADIRI|nr:unnamed protein product [Adineta ricciae]